MVPVAKKVNLPIVDPISKIPLYTSPNVPIIPY